MIFLICAWCACNLTVVDVEAPAITVDETARSVEVVSATEAARILKDQGIDRIGGIRGVTVDISGLAPGATVVIGAHTLAPGTTSFDLDDAEVDQLRVALLTPKAMTLPISFTFQADKPRTDPMVVILTPTLHVDVGRSL